jgi:hypothetical protein
VGWGARGLSGFTGLITNFRKSIDELEEPRQRKIDTAIARLESEARTACRRTNRLIAALGADHVFRSVDDAIRSARMRKII